MLPSWPGSTHRRFHLSFLSLDVGLRWEPGWWVEAWIETGTISIPNNSSWASEVVLKSWSKMLYRVVTYLKSECRKLVSVKYISCASLFATYITASRGIGQEEELETPWLAMILLDFSSITHASDKGLWGFKAFRRSSAKTQLRVIITSDDITGRDGKWKVINFPDYPEKPQAMEESGLIYPAASRRAPSSWRESSDLLLSSVANNNSCYV